VPEVSAIATLNTARLTLTQVCRLLERLEAGPFSRSLINYYGTRIAGFEPLVTASRKGGGRGSGRNTRLYSVADVVLLRWLLQLARQGLAVRKFYRAVEWLRKNMPEAIMDPEAVFFLTDNEEIGICCRKGAPIQLTGAPGQILLSLSVSSVNEVLEEAPKVLSA